MTQSSRPRFERPAKPRCLSTMTETLLPESTDPPSVLAGRASERLARPPVVAGPFQEAGRAAMAYTAVAEFFPASVSRLDAGVGRPDAAIFTVSYLASGVESRPVCFAVNGGPGASSAFLNMGVMGPRRITMNDDGSLPTPPYVLEDNDASWLDQADLVFIDPPETGYSVASSDAACAAVLSVDGDIDLLVDVIRAWLTRHGRWGATLYLAGEGYGGLRCAAACERLLDAGLALAGLILISPLLDCRTLAFEAGNDLPHALFLPAMAGVAHHHGRISSDVARSAAEARAKASDFVYEEYAGALVAGDRLSNEQRQRIGTRLSEITGLNLTVILENDLRVTDDVFLAELLRDSGAVVGKMDARCVAIGAPRRPGRMEFDPSIDTFYAPFRAAARLHLAEDIGVMVDDGAYHVFSTGVEAQWKWLRQGATGTQYASASSELARALRRNANLRIFVASGLFDLTTPFSATNWSLAHLDISRHARKERICHRFYEAGHMFYTKRTERLKLKADFEKWLLRRELDAG